MLRYDLLQIPLYYAELYCNAEDILEQIYFMMSIIGNFAKAKRLVGKPNSSLYLMSQVLHVPLPVEYLADINGAMMLLLKEELEIYSPELNGVPVAFNEKSSKMLGSCGSMISAQPYTYCDLQSEFVVFKPRVGDILDGVVNKVTPNLFECLIHNCFYATIYRKANEAKGISKIEVEKKIRFRVTKLQEDGNGVLSITGEISGQQPRQRESSANHVETKIDASVTSMDPGIELAASDVSSQKKSITPPRTVNSEEEVDQSDHNTSQSDSILTSTKTASPNKVYRDPQSIKHATQTTCYTVNVSAAESFISSDGTTTTASEGIVTGEKRKKHKKKVKKNKAEKLKSEQDSDEMSQTAAPVLNSAVNHHENIIPINSCVEESETTATNPDDEFSDDLFNPPKKESTKKEPQIPNSNGGRVNGTAKEPMPKPEKKFTKKRKRDAKAEGIASPPAKKVMHVDISKVMSEGLMPSAASLSAPSSSTATEISLHEREALFHLQKLGINLPLSTLKSGSLSPLKSASAVSESKLPKKEGEAKSNKRRKKQTLSNITSLESITTSAPLLSSDKSTENNSQSSENAFLYLRTEDTEATPKKNKKAKKKERIKSEAGAKDLNSNDECSVQNAAMNSKSPLSGQVKVLESPSQSSLLDSAVDATSPPPQKHKKEKRSKVKKSKRAKQEGKG